MRFNRPVSPFPFLRAWPIRGHSIRSTKSSSPSAVMASGTTRTDAGRRSGPISETLGPARATARSMAFFLADVAGPAIADQNLEGFARQSLDGFLLRRGIPAKQMLADPRNVLGTPPERG